MCMLRKAATTLAVAALGTGFAACGEDRSGDVQFEGDTATATVPEPMPGAPTTPTETTATGGEFLAPETTETTETETAP